ncbi:hypothetical protein [Streptococcus acidominimus]|uniref:Uncharacterized protein n=1 Tax=Streptococcus acidominimus TaxID=1326 RepID=A0A4Y9FNV3_STRAI|nr:hypothetical protein [Streptococcus acidominimus]MBF0818735.1 hypothetical protein [Streptococcus acidominimus]MBF0838321.1 hypothetical protein [Streptococcus acidominimus]MBF0848960.1 hypothetical protein [Streptococcus danieliae]TFU30897.1 hypothetical protein E4U01_04590 [Streptococcus acidominimus]
MARHRIKSEYRKQIEILQDYFLRSPVNPFNTRLEQAIQDRIEEIEYPYITGDLNADIKSSGAVRDFMAERLVFAKESDRLLRTLEKRQRICAEIIRSTPEDLLKVLKEVYVYERWSIEKEGSAAMFMSKEALYKKVREWFEDFEDRFYT